MTIEEIRSDNIVELKVALYLACDLVVLNMGGGVEECVEHHLKLAQQWLERNK